MPVLHGSSHCATRLNKKGDITYILGTNPHLFLQFHRAKKSDADYIRDCELDFGKMIEPLNVP
jgi:hypothetical protein